MPHSRRFWFSIFVAILLDSVFAECQKQASCMTNMTLGLHEISKRSTSDKKDLEFMSRLGVMVAGLSTLSFPVLGPIATFVVGSLINGLWPTKTDISPLTIVHIEMNKQSIQRMKMKLRGYKRQLNHLFGLLHLPSGLLQKWQNSIEKNGFIVNANTRWSKIITNQVNKAVYELFKEHLRAIAADIQNDRDVFHISNNPAISLAYYREFATLDIALSTALLLVDTDGMNQDPAALSRIERYYKNAIKTSAETHYRFVHWAAHKAASASEVTRKRMSYSQVVNSIMDQFPLKEWRSLSGFQDDSKYIRNRDEVSLKITGGVIWRYYGQWMSCWQRGSECMTRTCPGEDDPFGKCRGERFMIYGHLRHPSDYIRVCDKVAFRYDLHNNKGYWLSYNNGWWGRAEHFDTRTCPGPTFFDSRLYTCSAEIFTLTVVGRSCGKRLEDRDDVILQRGDGRYVGVNWSRMRPKGYPYHWRIFKHQSFIRNGFI